VGSIEYFLGGLSVLQYPFFFYAGSRLTARWSRPRNFLYTALVIASMVLSALSGGREPSLRILLAFLSGVAFSGLGFVSARQLALLFLPLLIVFMVAVQNARGDFNYRAINITERIGAVVSAANLVLAGETRTEQGGSMDILFLRVFEGTGQLVVDGIQEGDPLAGVEHFDRLPFLFLPKLVARDKQGLEDGPEVLARDYGVPITDFTSTPITFLADAYRRASIAGVAIAGFIAGWWLSILGVWLQRLSRSVAVLATTLISVQILRLYTASVLGFVSASTYGLVRDLFILWGIAALATRLAHHKPASANLRAGEPV
jgi:hypothetical protein